VGGVAGVEKDKEKDSAGEKKKERDCVFWRERVRDRQRERGRNIKREWG